MGRVVILVPAYRCEGTIGETLESIQQQGSALNGVSEVIIADDGSRDRTAEVARACWRASVPLKILERRFNCGEYASVNNAVEQLAPDVQWLLIMHADNIAKAGWLQAFLDRIEITTGDVGLIGSSYDTFAEGGPIQPGEKEPPDRIVTFPGTLASVAATLRMGCWWHISSCAIRVAAFDQVGGLPKVMQLKGDWDFMLRVLAKGWTIEHMPISLMLYRDNPAGSSSITFRRHMDILETLTVLGRFHWALKPPALARIHAGYVLVLLRRSIRSVLRLDPIRLVWILPAMAYTFASYWTCCLDRGQRIDVAPRRAVPGSNVPSKTNAEGSQLR